jgi:L-ascorbate metabolism protein UlaG (beta-lactamase superfamily)
MSLRRQRILIIKTSSHIHTDHLDGETLIPLIKANPGIKFIIPEANRAFVTDRIKAASDFPIGLNDGERVSIGGFTLQLYLLPTKPWKETKQAGVNF